MVSFWGGHEVGVKGDTIFYDFYLSRFTPINVLNLPIISEASVRQCVSRRREKSLAIRMFMSEGINLKLRMYTRHLVVFLSVGAWLPSDDTKSEHLFVLFVLC